MTVVTLTWAELDVCGVVAAMRASHAIRERWREKYNVDPNGESTFERHYFGCVGELAAAKRCNLFWPPAVGQAAGLDVGDRLQVRAARRNNSDLRLHPDDKDNHPFVLALAHDLPRVTLVGWIWAHAGKQPEYWKDPTGRGRPAFFVPQAKLWDIDELELVIGGNA